MKTEVIVYQNKNGEIELKGDIRHETLWASLQQIADLFETDKSGISRHIKNIFLAQELKPSSTVAKIATVQKEGKREITRKIEYYNLDIILSVGYRVNSIKATAFRKWATKTLHQHIIAGYTINRKQIVKNYEVFQNAIDNIKKLLPTKGIVKAEDALELVKMFSSTWLSLEAFDNATLPKSGVNKKKASVTANLLVNALFQLRQELIAKKEASELFGLETTKGEVEGIINGVFQSFGGRDLCPTLEEKAARLLYYFVKDHPFVDGNKRSGAFAFVWFLQNNNIFDITKITPEALTTLTLLVAESRPIDKERMIGLILLLLKK